MFKHCELPYVENELNAFVEKAGVYRCYLGKGIIGKNFKGAVVYINFSCKTGADPAIRGSPVIASIFYIAEGFTSNDKCKGLKNPKI